MHRRSTFVLDKHNSDERTAYLEIPLEALTLLISTRENALLTYPLDVTDHPLTRYPLDPSSAGKLLDPKRTLVEEQRITFHYQDSHAPLILDADTADPDLIRLEHGSTRHTIDLQEIWDRDRHRTDNPPPEETP